jgi:hypothetical protein
MSARGRRCHRSTGYASQLGCPVMVLTLPRYPDAFHGPRIVPATIDGEDGRGGDLSYPITSEK